MENENQAQRQLAELFDGMQLCRPMRIERYEPGTELTYAVMGVAPAREARVRLSVERFVGGGFAGQVYKVRLIDIEANGEGVVGLDAGGSYAMKILLPPTRFSCIFRDAIYKLAFQGPFSLQVNPAAARAGALWQKFIRRGAKIRFGSAGAVVDILANFVDKGLGSCGELSEWVDGRVWRFEVNDRLDELRRWRPGDSIDPQAGSSEYRAKRKFMAGFVELLHDMGAHEFARQYEWWTCKSQPNVLKRRDSEDDALAGLTAVDFRAGLALLPVLPMSPGDIKLIITGLARGSVVQFDRGDLAQLRRFVGEHEEDFTDMRDSLDELTVAEEHYRNSQIDVTHNHVRLLYSRWLWSGIADSTVTACRVRNLTDDATAGRLRRSRLLTLIFCILGYMPGISVVSAIVLLVWTWGLVWAGGGYRLWTTAVALAAGLVFVAAPAWRLMQRIWGRADLRRHYGRALISVGYFSRAARGRCTELAAGWLRRGRLNADEALKLARSPWRLWVHLPLSILPVFLHRLLTDRRYAAELGRYIFVRPVRLYFNADAREQWLREMVAEGQRRHMLTDEDAERIISRIKEPFIQKYLKSLAVHVCTLPITQVVSVIVAVVYVRMHPEFSWAEAWGYALGILAAFQLVPVSPGSLVRGLYVVYLVIKERNFKDYNIAVFMGFFKYIGYLSFPIQMAYKYPTLARFMAGHWATGAVHVIPVFGEHGALLEHGVFDLFYNYPLTVRRRMRRRARARAGLKRRFWHLGAIAAAVVGLFALVDWTWINSLSKAPRIREIWWLVVPLLVLAGACASIWAGRASVKLRVAKAVVLGAVTGAGYAAVHGGLMLWAKHFQGIADTRSYFEVFGAGLLWRMFAFTLFAVLGALAAEVFLPEPKSDGLSLEG